MDEARTEADRAFKGEPPKPVLYRQQAFGLDSVFTGAAMLIVILHLELSDLLAARSVVGLPREAPSWGADHFQQFA